MLQVYRSDQRGGADHGWLKTKHSFSFADYYDPARMGFRSLRVINEDHIAGGTGFGAHPHRDMEIISYVVSGALEHQDSMGNKAIIVPGEVQRMSAGRGVVHSEYNREPDADTHLFQVWILPKTLGQAPGYGQKSFAQELAKNKLTLVVSESGRDGSISIRQDADLYIGRLAENERVSLELRPKRGVWIQVIKGEIIADGQTLRGGDAASFDGSESKSTDSQIDIRAAKASEFMLFDLA